MLALERLRSRAAALPLAPASLPGLGAVLACLLSCAHPRPVNIADAVLPYSYDLEAAEPLQAPFVARFDKHGQTLFFVAAKHGCDPDTFRLIDEVLATHRVRLAIIEGYPAGQGINPPRFARNFDDWRANGFCKGGAEAGYAASHAVELGASFLGGEPDERAIAQAVLRQGFAPEDLLGFYFVRQVPQLRREGTLETKGLEASFHHLIAAKGKAAGLEEAIPAFSLDRFQHWYLERQGKPFDVATMDDEEPAPIASGKYFTQRISAVVGLARDRAIVELIARRLADDKAVLVVYGASHFPTQRPAIELLMGKPVARAPRGR